MFEAMVGAAAAPTLLYGATYVVDEAGPGSPEWPPALAMLAPVGLGLAFATEWLLLDRAILHAPATAVVGALVVSIMLLVVGRFFARLTSVHAILSFCAASLCAVFELPVD